MRVSYRTLFILSLSIFLGCLFTLLNYRYSFTFFAGWLTFALWRISASHDRRQDSHLRREQGLEMCECGHPLHVHREHTGGCRKCECSWPVTEGNR